MNLNSTEALVRPVKRHATTTFVAAALLILLRASGSASTVTNAPIVQDSIPRVLLAELEPLGSRVSLGEWRQRHRADSVSMYLPTLNSERLEGWCASVRGRDSTTGTIRLAYFFPPEIGGPPPVNVAADAQLNRCELGLLWVFTDVDSAAAPINAQALRRSLIAQIGEPDAGATPTPAMTYSLVSPAFWRTSTVVVASGASKRQRLMDQRERVDSWRAFAAAAPIGGPVALITDRSADPSPTSFRDNVLEQLRNQSGIVFELLDGASVSAAAESSVRTVLESAAQRAELGTRGESTVELERAIDVLLAGQAQRSVRQRAAILVVLDFLVQLSGSGVSYVSTGQEDSTGAGMRRRFESRGVVYNYSHLGMAWVDTRAWLKEALAIDPGGRAGAIAFRELLQIGFETSGTCGDQNGKGFRAVVSRGTQFLRDNPNSGIEVDVRLAMARAYGEIVRLAAGGTYEALEPPGVYASEAEFARRMALQEYAQVLALAPAAPWVQEVHQAMFRLSAGIAPARSWFYCVYD